LVKTICFFIFLEAFWKVGNRKPMDFFVSDRMRRVLATIVEDYILTAEPVGSKTVSYKSSLSLSPASIRSIMAELEELGLLFQPHISAGRVPTEKGFRFYVDHILDVHELSQDERDTIRLKLPSHQGEATDIFRGVSRVLSSVSHYLGVVWAPRVDLIVLRHIEFVKLGPHLVLTLLVGANGLVQNRLIETEGEFSQAELAGFSDAMNDLLSGLTLQQVRTKLVEQMRQEKTAYDSLLEQALKLGEDALSSLDDSAVFIEGRTNILEDPDFGNVSRMKDLFAAFEEKATMVRLLDKCMEPQGVKIAIGSESQIREIETCSLVTSTYGSGGKVLGALGVIGPRRMNYSKVIPLVDFAARILSEVLEEQ
jgi:heat-inducible transcriptional repressor